MYCLDTNIVIYFQNGNSKVVQKLLSQNENEICITYITRAELFYGAYRSQKVSQNLAFQENFCSQIQVICPTYSSDNIFGKLKATLRKTGLVVADLDLLIASICIANNYILVTNNAKHFKYIENLQLEDWSA